KEEIYDAWLGKCGEYGPKQETMEEVNEYCESLINLIIEEKRAEGAQTTYANGWTDLTEAAVVSEYKCNVSDEVSFINVDVLTVDRNELDKASRILNAIAKETDVASLPEEFASAEIACLKDELLPPEAQKEAIKKAIRDKRATFLLETDKPAETVKEHEVSTTTTGSTSSEKEPEVTSSTTKTAGTIQTSSPVSSTSETSITPPGSPTGLEKRERSISVPTFPTTSATTPEKRKSLRLFGFGSKKESQPQSDKDEEKKGLTNFPTTTKIVEGEATESPTSTSNASKSDKTEGARNTPATRKRRKKILKQAKGYFGSKHKLFKTAKEQVNRSLVYAYRDRKAEKRRQRQNCISRINAACCKRGLKYSRFMRLKVLAQIKLDRKQLSEMAIHQPSDFAALINKIQNP
ncbi:8213_t:CDS:2, partial [Racocetra persica]